MPILLADHKSDSYNRNVPGKHVMTNPQNDRNLLFGILAMQMDFVSRDGLVAGMNAWVLAKQRPLSEILVEQGQTRGR